MKNEQTRPHINPIIENALDAVITIDADGIITGWNKQAETTFGWSRQEAQGLHLSDTIIPPQYREAHNQGMRHYLATGEGLVLNNRIEITALHRSGREFPVELTVTPLRTDESITFSAFVRDITERKQAGEALRESEARAQAVLENAAEGIITIDEQGVIESFNPAAARIFGYSVDEVTGQNVSMLMPEPHHSRHDGYIANYLSTGRGKIIGTGREIEGRRKDGTSFPIHLAVSEVALGNRRIFTGILHDISDLKQAEKSLQQLNEELEQRVTERTAQLVQTNDDLSREIIERERLESRYRALFEEAPAMYVITKNSDDVPYIKDCNQLFATVLGYNRQDIMDRPLFDFYTVESRTELMVGGYQRALTGEFTIEDRQLVTKDGRVIETLLRARPELDANGNVIGTRAMFADITERKQMEAAEREQRVLAEALREAALIISTSLDFDTVLDHILEQIARVVPYDGINIMLVENGRTQTARLRGYEQFGQDVVQEMASLSLDIRKTPNLYRLLESRQPYIIADTTHYPDWQAGGVTGHCRSWAAAPICIRDEVVAFLLLDKIEPDFYQPKDAPRLAAFATQAAVAFENARLYQATQQQIKELTALNTISQAAISTLELEQILDVITDHIFQLLDIEAASLVLKDKDSDQLLFATAAGIGADVIKDRRMAANQGIVGWCIEHGEPTLVPDVSVDPRFYKLLDHATDHTTRSVLCVPLHIKGKTIGAIEVTNKRDGVFNQQDLQLLSSVAAPVATAIDNAQLYQQIRRHATELEQRVAERTTELSAANAELARAARLKDEFLASMSHELRTPLNAILGMSEALQEKTFGPLNVDQLEALHDIEDSGRHLLSLINDILDLSKVEAGKLELQIEEVTVESISEASLRLIKQLAHKKRLKVFYTVDDMVTTIQADERYLKQILVNLLSNAVKFTPEGGRVGLETMGDASQEIVRFTVWDTGIGIQPEDMERLFQPFVQLDSRLDRQYSGTGLGLALVYRMTELHGGSISVTSDPGKGSRFTVTLPWRKQENSADIAETPQAVISATSQQANIDRAVVTAASAQSSAYKPLILMAEDNQSNIKTISRYLTRVGYRVEVALNGIEAITQARVLQPDLILMDIQMPEMDGLEATRHLRADPHLGDIPIIAVTALAMAGDRERCLAAGANDYLSKPVNLKMLAETIGAQLARSGDS